MQLAPITPVSLVVQPTAAPMVAAPAVALPAPAAPSAPLAIQGAVDGVARLATTAAAPIVDFPGVKKGDVFDIVKGSKAGPIGVRGHATVNLMDPDHANITVNAGRFGIKVDVEVDIQQISPTEVRITSHGSGLPDQAEIGRVVESSTNHAIFEQVSDPSKRTRIDRDAKGNIVIDAPIPTIGDVHLVLEPRR